jgi:hypothetical protein
LSVTNECTPYQEPGERLPCSVRAGKTVVGKRFVVIGADMQGDPNGLSTDVEGSNYVIEPAAANALAVLGVASHNAAEKKKVTVLASPGMVVPVVAGAAINAGEQVGVGAEGKAVKAVAASEAEIKEGKAPWKVPPVGMALADAAEGVDCPVKLY